MSCIFLIVMMTVTNGVMVSSEGLSIGWFQEYIYPYDDPYNLTISPERKLRLAQEPERIIVSAEAYDELVRRINEPPDPAVVERIKEIMNRKAPWDDEDEIELV